MRDGGERIAALEVEVRYLRSELSDAHRKIDEMYALMMQGRGAWWVIVVLSGVVGFVAGMAHKLLPVLGR